MEDPVIICVDDDPLSLEALSSGITVHSRGCAIESFQTGSSVIERFRELQAQERPLALLLTSQHLRDMSGEALAEQLQRHDPCLPAILLTDHRPPTKTGTAARIFRSIAKPWGLEDLLFTVSGGLDDFFHRRQVAAQTAALQDSDQRLRAVIEKAADGILTISQYGIIQSANPSVERIFGYSSAALIGSNISLLMPVPSAEQHNAYIRAYLNGGPATAVDATREVMGRHADGTLIPLEVSVSEFSVDGARVFSGILRDISERRRAEQLAREKTLAERQAATKSEFLATMSHEIRTPMNGVLGMLELLEATRLTGEQANLLGICRDSAQYLLTIIDDILDFSKIEAGKLQFDNVECKLDDLIFSVSELLCSRAWAKDLELVSYVENTLPASVYCDPARIRQILINLIGNAIKFTHQGQVSVRARPLEPDSTVGSIRKIRFEIMDTGIGMTAEQCSRLFRPFEQADVGTTRRFGGTGLGLAISRRLVEMMGGQIGVNSSEGIGSTFWFELPLKAASAPPPRPRLSPSARILLIAANPIFRDAVERGLSAAGARVETVERFQDALLVAQQEKSHDPFSLVVVEDGCAASHGAYSGDASLKAPGFGAIPILLLARRDRGPIADILATTGADYGLSRPARPGLLLTTVKVALGQESPAALENVQIGGIKDARNSDHMATPFSGGRVLVAEDTPTSRLVVTKMLERMGITPVLTEDGAQAWHLLQSKRFDLLLTDCHMPELDGFGLSENIRAAERNGQIFRCDSDGLSGSRLPILALSAGVLEEEKARCMAAGMDGFIAKPVESKILHQALLQWLPSSFHPKDVSLAASGQRVAYSPAGMPPQAPPYDLPRPPPDATRQGHDTAPQTMTPEQERIVSQVLGECDDKRSAASNTSANSDVLDLSIYHELFGEINDEVRGLFCDFFEGTDPLIDQLMVECQDQQWHSLGRIAHRIAGAALTAGAVELGTLCRTIEQAVLQQHPQNEIIDHVVKVPEVLERTKTAVSTL